MRFDRTEAYDGPYQGHEIADTGSTGNPFADAFLALARAWMPVCIAAPDQLTESVLPGWSLISVNETNSASPDTERAILAKASYGRQIGRIFDAVEQLVKERPAGSPERKAFTALAQLAEDVERTKQDAGNARLDQLRSDLARLKASNVKEFERQRAALLEILG